MAPQHYNIETLASRVFVRAGTPALAKEIKNYLRPRTLNVSIHILKILFFEYRQEKEKRVATYTLETVFLTFNTFHV